MFDEWRNTMEQTLQTIREIFGDAPLISARRIEKWLGIKDLSKTSLKIKMVGNRRMVSALSLARWLS